MKGSCCRGILLLEVLLSVAILAGALILISASLSTSQKLVLKSRVLSEGTLRLRETLFQVWEPEELENRTRSGSWGGEAAWQWRIESQPYRKGLLHIRAEVQPAAPSREGAVFAETIALHRGLQSSEGSA